MLKRHQILYHLKSVAIQLCWDKASNLVDMHPSRPQSHVHRNFSRDEHLGCKKLYTFTPFSSKNNSLKETLRL